MPLETIFNLFKPDLVFSLSFLIGFLGFGYFVNNSLFPWLKEWLSFRAAAHEANQNRFDVIISVISEFRAELSAFRETHSIILAYLISDLTENKPETAGDSAAARALKRRQTTQDMLLRRLEDDKAQETKKL